MNGFDEAFSGWGHEDADLVLRLHNHGARRKNGFFGTEVFHLWHRENSRENEAVNRATGAGSAKPAASSAPQAGAGRGCQRKRRERTELN